uniref:Uncharacterized protein n=1 Tax=Cannabis sativa TaxID=3483 RepID=A0A803RAU6_CANSA
MMEESSGSIDVKKNSDSIVVKKRKCQCGAECVVKKNKNNGELFYGCPLWKNKTDQGCGFQGLVEGERSTALKSFDTKEIHRLLAAINSIVQLLLEMNIVFNKIADLLSKMNIMFAKMLQCVIIYFVMYLLFKCLYM